MVVSLLRWHASVWAMVCPTVARLHSPERSRGRGFGPIIGGRCIVRVSEDVDDTFTVEGTVECVEDVDVAQSSADGMRSRSRMWPTIPSWLKVASKEMKL